jgi:Phorbol esters/diacylglycerol binding domain (C1 domain)
MDKIRNIDPTQNRTEILAALTSPRVRQPAGILKKNMTDSVYDVEDFSFDDTQDLCESRSRLFDRSDVTRRSSRGKRSRSGNRRADEEDPVLEDIASPRKDPAFAARKKARRSRSVVAFEVPSSIKTGDDDDTDIELGRQQRAFSLTERSEPQQRRRESRSKGAGLPSPAPKKSAATGGEPLHSFAQKTVLKPEKCYVCQKRIKFGKICLKCAGCRMTVHSECSDKAPPLCVRSQSPEVCVTPRAETGAGGLSRSPSKKAYFASPMLR